MSIAKRAGGNRTSQKNEILLVLILNVYVVTGLTHIDTGFPLYYGLGDLIFPVNGQLTWLNFNL